VSSATVENELEAQQTLKLYCDAIAQLPKKCRQVYLLRKVQGLSHKEIAQRMGISLSGVEKQLHIGMSKCRDYMEKHGGEPRRSSTAPVANVLRDSGGYG
jgi:RNA polymerase sigma-70 factor (ECF subfamily)